MTGIDWRERIPYLGQKTQKEGRRVKLRGALYRLENDSEQVGGNKKNHRTITIPRMGKPIV